MVGCLKGVFLKHTYYHVEGIPCLVYEPKPCDISLEFKKKYIWEVTPPSELSAKSCKSCFTVSLNVQNIKYTIYNNSNLFTSPLSFDYYFTLYFNGAIVKSIMVFSVAKNYNILM